METKESAMSAETEMQLTIFYYARLWTDGLHFWSGTWQTDHVTNHPMYSEPVFWKLSYVVGLGYRGANQ